uniref:Immunoglobulin superfamily, member 3 n=3 Tax=Sinocyclocheilus grahami TaxID=75366 RepID=A0A672SVY2_SINGR
KLIKNTYKYLIPDTLTVMATAQTLSKVEGDTLQLSCEVTRQTSQHTHVSVGWYLRPSDDPSSGPRDLVTLSRDFVLRPGGQYRQRLSSGDLRLDKTSPTSYRLTIYKLQPPDQGEFYCETSEWIQDPDRSWYAMTRKESEKTSVKVQPTDRDFSIQVTTERRAYTAGEPLELRCTIDAQNVPERFFSVSWVFSSSPVAVIGPSAVPVLGPNYMEREATGLLTVRKESPSVHLLKLQRLLPEDSGKYICRVTEREKTLTGDFIDRSKRSRNVQISVTPLRSNITVSLSSNTSEIMEGETVQLTCVVSSTVGPLSVSWQWTDKEGAGPAVNVASVDREGTVTPGPTFRERSSFGEIRVERVRPDTFTLFLYNAFPTDEGQYRCSATEWSQSGTAPDWIWQQIGDESATKTVTVKSVESFFFVSASSRTPSVTFGDSFDLQCIVKPRHNPNVPAAVTWRFQPAEGDGEFRDLVTFTRDGTLQWGDQLLGLGTRTMVDRTPTNTNFRLSITRAGRKEAGTYQCAALLYRRNYDGTWSTVANRTSNPLGISVLQPGESKNGYRRRKGACRLPDCLTEGKNQLNFAQSLKRSGPTLHRQMVVRPDTDWFSDPPIHNLPNTGQDMVFTQLSFCSYTYLTSILNCSNSFCPPPVSTLQSVVCSNDSLFYFVFFYPFPIFGILLIAVLLVRYKTRSSSKNQEGKNGAPLLWIKEPHLSYSPTCLDPPALSLHPGSVE